MRCQKCTGKENPCGNCGGYGSSCRSIEHTASLLASSSGIDELAERRTLLDQVRDLKAELEDAEEAIEEEESETQIVQMLLDAMSRHAEKLESELDETKIALGIANAGWDVALAEIKANR